MTEPRASTPKARRLRARHLMQALTAACVVAALVPGGQQLVSSGWAAFITRPPGVGATAPDKPAPNVAQAPPLPGINLLPQPPVAVAPPATAQPTTSAGGTVSPPVHVVAPSRFAAKAATFQARSSSHTGCLSRTRYRR